MVQISSTWDHCEIVCVNLCEFSCSELNKLAPTLDQPLFETFRGCRGSKESRWNDSSRCTRVSSPIKIIYLGMKI